MHEAVSHEVADTLADQEMLEEQWAVLLGA
jgi:hypothetical protein